LGETNPTRFKDRHEQGGSRTHSTYCPNGKHIGWTIKVKDRREQGDSRTHTTDRPNGKYPGWTFKVTVKAQGQHEQVEESS
jgi:hypothetical protein